MRAPTTLTSTIDTVHRGFGGELQFWLAVVRGNIPSGAKDVYSRAAVELARLGEPHRLADLTSLEESGARADLDNVLEAGACLVDASEGLLSASVTTRSNRPVVERVRAGVLDLLDAARVVLPPGREAVIGAEMVDRLTGREALDRFEDLLAWLAEIRCRYAKCGPGVRLPARLAMTERLSGSVFARRSEAGYQFHLSFRLFLRSRLYQICKKAGWECREQRGLRWAFHTLSREQIGEIFDRALTDWTAHANALEYRALLYLARDVVPAR